MDDSVKQRINHVIRYFKTSKNKLANGDQALQKRLSTQLNGTTRLTNQTISFIIEKFPEVNETWLMTGNGEMLKEEVSGGDVQILYHPKSIDKMADKPIQLYDMEAAANLLSIFEGGKGKEPIGPVFFPNMPVCDGAVYVRGDSMYPLLKSGDIVAYKVLHDIQSIVWGEMYLVDVSIEGDHYIAVKYVHHSDKGDDWVKLVSHNNFFDPKDVRIESINAIALVKFSVRINTM